MIGWASRLARATALAAAALILWTSSAFAHQDGTPEEFNPPRHYYYWATQTTQADIDPQVACNLYCTVTQSRAYYTHYFDPGDSNGKWKCQCEAASPPGAPGTIHTATNGNERHCNLGEAFTSGTGGACSSGGPSNCMARKGELVSWSWANNPHGFNLPEDEDDIPAGTWKGLHNCSVKRISHTDTGYCYSVTYSITGSGPVDEDGLPLVLDDGNNWTTGVPGTCNEVDDTTDDWPDDDGGGSGGFDLSGLLEEHGDLDDPLVGPNEQLEEDTDSWLDTLTEPVEWTEDVFDSFLPDFELFDVTGATCGSSVVINLQDIAGPGALWTISCEDTEQIRDLLGLVMLVAFGWWLIMTVLEMPKTGG